MLDQSQSHSTQTTSANSTPDIKQTHSSPTKKVKSSLLFSTVTQESIHMGNEIPDLAKKLRFYFVAEKLDVILEMPCGCNVEQALTRSLLHFSQTRTIDTNQSHYDVYVAKKNGGPKTDYPAFQFNQLLSKTGTNLYSIVHVTDLNQSSISQNLLNKQQKKLSFNHINAQSESPQKSKRKYTDSPTHLVVESPMIYQNNLVDFESLQARRKTQSKEILQTSQTEKVKPKRNWILELFGCGCKTD